MIEDCDDLEYMTMALLPSITDCLIEMAQESRAAKAAYERDKLKKRAAYERDKLKKRAAYERDKLKKRAAEAGFDDVGKYTLDCIYKDPKYPARQYLECVNEYGAGSTRCERDKETWLKLKAAQNGKKVAWNEEEIHKMLKEDAIKAGYTEGYFLHKDPKYLECAAREYEKCIAKHGVGAENTLCETQKYVWLKAKAFQNKN